MMLDGSDVPLIPRGVRIHQDKVRDCWVLQAPERAIILDEIGLAILRKIDGKSSFGTIVGELATTYNAPVDAIGTDVSAFITQLTDRRILEITT